VAQSFPEFLRGSNPTFKHRLDVRLNSIFVQFFVVDYSYFPKNINIPVESELLVGDITG